MSDGSGSGGKISHAGDLETERPMSMLGTHTISLREQHGQTHSCSAAELQASLQKKLARMEAGKENEEAESVDEAGAHSLFGAEGKGSGSCGHSGHSGHSGVNRRRRESTYGTKPGRSKTGSHRKSAHSGRVKHSRR